MKKMCSCSPAPRIIVIVPRVPIVQSDHYHCYQITAELQRPEQRGGEAGADILLSSDTTLCYPGAAQTPWPELDKQDSIEVLYSLLSLRDLVSEYCLEWLPYCCVVVNWTARVCDRKLALFPGPPEGSIIWNCPPPHLRPVQAVLIIWSLTSRPGLGRGGLWVITLSPGPGPQDLGPCIFYARQFSGSGQG